MVYKADNLLGLDHISHGFFSRRGGLSQGVFSSLNCRPISEDPHALENRKLVAESLKIPPQSLLSPSQVHGNSLQEVDHTTSLDTLIKEKHDALLTESVDVGLGILTADCVPVLFAHKNRPIVAAAHAGWRGALGGILDTTVNHLKEKGCQPQELVVAIGPAIQQPSFEVGSEVREIFLEKSKDFSAFFVDSKNPDKFMMDLPGYIHAALANHGIDNIERFPHDTYAHKEEFFSYRRNTHHGEKRYGCMISVISLKNPSA